MSELWALSADAIALLFSGDADLWEIVFVSLRVSLLAIIISTPVAFIMAFMLAHYQCGLEKIFIPIIHTLTAVPAVVVGLLVYLLLSTKGPFSDLHWLFTQKAMIIGQILLALPILLSVTYAGLKGVTQEAKETAITLGASPWQLVLTIAFECKFVLMTAVITSFGRIIAEVGSAMMLGGNILHWTRNVTTAIVLETHKGNFSQGIALGIVLVFLTLFLNILLAFLNKKRSS